MPNDDIETMQQRVAARYRKLRRYAFEQLYRLQEPTLIEKTAKRFELKLRKNAIEKIARFTDATLRTAFERAGGRCECTRKECDEEHEGRCPATFKWSDRGSSDDPDAWQGHHWIAQAKGGTDNPANCEILCVPCHIGTASYGRSS